MKITRREFLDILSKWRKEGTQLDLAINDGLDKGAFGARVVCRVVKVTNEKITLEGQDGSVNIFPFRRGTKYSYTEPRPSKRWSSTVWIQWASGSRCMIAEKK